MEDTAEPKETSEEKNPGNDSGTEIGTSTKEKGKAEGTSEDEPRHSVEDGEKGPEDSSFLVEENCRSFRDLLDEFRPHIASAGDLFVLCLHALMLELGFISELSHTELMSLSWRKPTYWQLQYRYPGGEGDSWHSFRLSVFRLGPTVTKVHGLSMSDKASYSTTNLSPEEFTEGVEGRWNLRNVRRLARIFKNSVGYPLLQAARLLAGQQSGGLLSMPPELGLTIIFNLGAPVIIDMFYVSVGKRFEMLGNSAGLWPFVSIVVKSDNLPTFVRVIVVMVPSESVLKGLNLNKGCRFT
jgi:hypothetical protein